MRGSLAEAYSLPALAGHILSSAVINFLKRAALAFPAPAGHLPSTPCHSPRLGGGFVL